MACPTLIIDFSNLSIFVTFFDPNISLRCSKKSITSPHMLIAEDDEEEEGKARGKGMWKVKEHCDSQKHWT